MTRLDKQGRRGSIELIVMAAVLTAICFAILWISPRFEQEVAGPERPLLVALGMLALATGVYLVEIFRAWKLASNKTHWRIVLGASILFRLALLPSTPIQEIDIYRYLWDGEVIATGVSPFQYAPEQVSLAPADIREPEALRKLVQLRDTDPAAASILGRIHYADLPTVYPPVSQAVFATATVTQPPGLSARARLIWLKAFLIGFDLGTLLLVAALLRMTGQSPTLALAYGWCPLVLKEIANSGHLDAIATFFCTAAVTLAVAIARRRQATEARGESNSRSFKRPLILAAVCGLALALGVGAKLYPLVLAPLLIVSLARSVSWRAGAFCAIGFLVPAIVFVWPMLPNDLYSKRANEIPAPPSATAEQDASRGIATFLTRWEMNDLLFLIALENLRDLESLPPEKTAWFSVVPQSVRVKLIAATDATLGCGPFAAPFLMARGMSLLIYSGLALWWLRHAALLGSDPRHWLEYVFLTLAWFFLLSPTLNPWYWTWIVPLLPFMRNRAWYAPAGLLFIYYLRFWFANHAGNTALFGTPYVGTDFFDLVVTWWEHAPWILWLAGEGLVRRYRPKPMPTQDLSIE